jgi:hypothetical protein
LQAELQGLADRLEVNSGHPSYTNLIGRVCLGTQEVCTWYYQNHFWYSNTSSDKYEKMLQHVQMEHDLAVAILSHTPVEKAFTSHVLLQKKPAQPPTPPDILDIEHKCDNGNTTCYSLGLKSGFVDGRNDRLIRQISYLCNE